MAAETTVFVVDDDAMVRESTQALLEVHGFQTRGFDSAEEFLAAYDPQWRGVVVLDIRLSGMSGLQLLDRLAGQGCRLPVILISGHTDAQSEAQNYRSLSLAILGKPLAAGTLLEHIRRAVEERLADEPR